MFSGTPLWGVTRGAALLKKIAGKSLNCCGLTLAKNQALTKNIPFFSSAIAEQRRGEKDPEGLSGKD